MTTGLIGHTGFVGGNLVGQRAYDFVYHRQTIAQIAGRSFDLMICAGAPALMWAANNDPGTDKANLDRLTTAIASARVKTLVLISTIAVLDDLAAGYSETTAQFETRTPYGRHRRALEVALGNHCERLVIIRLPALFGPGLKKNFIYDLINPIPSFMDGEKFAGLRNRFTSAERALLLEVFAINEDSGIWAVDRAKLKANPGDAATLREGFAQAGFVARNFTNSQSRYQFYNIERLAGDIDRCLERGHDILHVCSTPMEISAVHELLTGEAFVNTQPPVVCENICTQYADDFGGDAPYLISGESMRDDLVRFYKREVGG